jgi:hypothetical protein
MYSYTAFGVQLQFFPLYDEKNTVPGSVHVPLPSELYLLLFAVFLTLRMIFLSRGDRTAIDLIRLENFRSVISNVTAAPDIAGARANPAIIK